jgi:hypothetical protein
MPGCLFAERNTSCIQVNGVEICIADGVVQYGHDRQRLAAVFPENAMFAQDASGRPQIVPTKVGKVIAIVDSKPFQGRNDCETIIRGILVTSEGKVRLSPRTQNVSMCSLGPWDEKMFIVFGQSALND